MRRKKEVSCPIAGQSRLDKVVDWLARVGQLDRWMTMWSVIWLTLCGAILFSVKLLGMPAVGRRLVVLMAACTPIMLVGMIVTDGLSLWGDLAEKRFKERILQRVTEQGNCTYDELVCCCYKRHRLHLGVDGALKTLLDCHELACDSGDTPGYRLPAEEDLRQWRRESAEACGMTISFRELEVLFSQEAGLRMDLFVDDRDVYLCKLAGMNGEPTRFWCELDENTYYSTFQALADSPMFDGRSLRQVWEDDVIVTDINDQWPEGWLNEHLPKDELI